MATRLARSSWSVFRAAAGLVPWATCLAAVGTRRGRSAWKLGSCPVIGYVLISVSATFGRQWPPLDWKSATRLPVYLVGMGIISWQGQCGPDNTFRIPFGIDMLIILARTLVIFTGPRPPRCRAGRCDAWSPCGASVWVMSLTCRGTEPGWFGAAIAALVVIGWPGTSSDPAALIGRVGVVAAPVLLTAAWWAARRVFGPPGGSRLARGARVGGYLAVYALVLVNARAQRFEYAAWRGGSWLSGLWIGEAIFLVAMAAYVAGVTAVTARRSPVGPAALAVGTAAGAATAPVVLALPAVGNPLHVTRAALPVVHALGRGVGLPLVLAGGVVAGLIAARRTPGPGSARSLADVRARQSVSAGLCAGATATLLVSIAGGATVDVAHLTAHFPPALPAASPAPASVLAFEVGLADSAAGYLPALVVLPLLGAGLAAWGGLWAAGSGGQSPGSDGGGGSGGPLPPPSPPGGRSLDEDADVAPDRRERVLVGAAER